MTVLDLTCRDSVAIRTRDDSSSPAALRGRYAGSPHHAAIRNCANAALIKSLLPTHHPPDRTYIVRSEAYPQGACTSRARFLGQRTRFARRQRAGNPRRWFSAGPRDGTQNVRSRRQTGRSRQPVLADDIYRGAQRYQHLRSPFSTHDTAASVTADTVRLISS